MRRFFFRSCVFLVHFMTAVVLLQAVVDVVSAWLAVYQPFLRLSFRPGFDPVV